MSEKLLDLVFEAQSLQLLEDSYRVNLIEKSLEKPYKTVVDRSDPTTGEVVVLSANGKKTRANSITNRSLSKGDFVELTAPPGGRGFVDARVVG